MKNPHKNKNRNRIRNKKRNKKETIHFSGRRHTKTGIVSTVIGALSILGFIAVCIVSGIADGKGGILIGFAGLLLLMISIEGFVLSYKAFKKKDIFYVYPVVGAILNGVMIILYMSLYILGIAI